MTALHPAGLPSDGHDVAVGSFLALLARDLQDRRFEPIDPELAGRAMALVAGAVVDLDEALSPDNE